MKNKNLRDYFNQFGDWYNNEAGRFYIDLRVKCSLGKLYQPRIKNTETVISHNHTPIDEKEFNAEFIAVLSAIKFATSINPIAASRFWSLHVDKQRLIAISIKQKCSIQSVSKSIKTHRELVYRLSR